MFEDLNINRGDAPKASPLDHSGDRNKDPIGKTTRRLLELIDTLSDTNHLDSKAEHWRQAVKILETLNPKKLSEDEIWIICRETGKIESGYRYNHLKRIAAEIGRRARKRSDECLKPIYFESCCFLMRQGVQLNKGICHLLIQHCESKEVAIDTVKALKALEVGIRQSLGRGKRTEEEKKAEEELIEKLCSNLNAILKRSNHPTPKDIAVGLKASTGLLELKKITGYELIRTLVNKIKVDNLKNYKKEDLIDLIKALSSLDPRDLFISKDYFTKILSIVGDKLEGHIKDLGFNHCINLLIACRKCFEKCGWGCSDTLLTEIEEKLLHSPNNHHIDALYNFTRLNRGGKKLAELINYNLNNLNPRSIISLSSLAIGLWAFGYKESARIVCGIAENISEEEIQRVGSSMPRMLGRVGCAIGYEFHKIGSILDRLCEDDRSALLTKTQSEAMIEKIFNRLGLRFDWRVIKDQFYYNFQLPDLNILIAIERDGEHLVNRMKRDYEALNHLKVLIINPKMFENLSETEQDTSMLILLKNHTIKVN